VKTEKFSTTLSVAALAIAGGELVLNARTEATRTDDEAVSIHTMARADASKVANLLSIGPNSAHSASTRFITLLRSNTDWLESDETEFSDLATKEALSLLSDSDLAQLERLQVRRRTQLDRLPAEVILSRHRREKLDQELLELLRRYVHISEQAPYPA
jgi:hypothetical protein